MKLHRVGKKADWQLIPPEKHSYWQRLAARSHGIVTPANVLSVLGLALVAVGLWLIFADMPVFGLVLVILGRIADIFDGLVAEHTGTKSLVGEAIDAGFDKIAIILLLITSIVLGLLPAYAIIAVAVLNLLTIIVSLVARFRQIEIHSHRLGKWSTAAMWLAIISYLTANLVQNSVAEFSLFAVAIIGFIFFVLAGGIALCYYASVAFRKQAVKTT